METSSGRLLLPFAQSTITIFVLVVLMILFNKTSCAIDNHLCTSSCGNITHISSPFRLTSDPSNCGDLRYNLSCENYITILYLDDEHKVRYLVKAINYNNYTIRLMDPSVQENDCSSIPSISISLHSLPSYVLFMGRSLYEEEINWGSRKPFSHPAFKTTRQLFQTILFFTCENPVSNNSSGYVESGFPCTFNRNFSSNITFSQTKRYSYYYVMNGVLRFADLEDTCRIEQISLIATAEKDFTDNNTNSRDIHNALVHGFELSWVQSFAKEDDGICYIDYETSGKVFCLPGCIYTYGLRRRVVSSRCNLFLMIYAYLDYHLVIRGGYKYVLESLAPRVIVGVSFMIGLLIYQWRRRHLSMYGDIEKFLQSHNNLVPIRYSYLDVKKMTNGFKHKLGEGGFGSVFKGKLRSGHLVAIKMLGKSRGTNLEEFINEVATIGRIHHVNIVQLIGFCVEGSKHALVFDFMPNGSLDKYIFYREGFNSLSCKRMFEISLGVAHGIEYLHRGCDMQILHFDIKPHNILLDDSFIPMVSDFGLARLCPLDNSIVSLTTARGTIGYIAPELFYKNIGGVSYKADVYSFGMLLMEMASKKKNVDANAENSSQIYFPLWIYDQLSKGNDIKMEDITEEESETIKKMTIVALWCIQIKPCDRPSMNKVIEMLEGNVECLQMPPKPYLFPEEQENRSSVEDPGITSCSSTMPSVEEVSQEISLISNLY